jgi:glycosyltransferase involved in cell wall biosynthesis
MVSVLIPTLNERLNIADCIASVTWASEVVLVDSGSLDGTVELAESKGARVVQFRWNKQFPKKKNWALENVAWKNDWVLILDADERITPGLALEIQQELQRPLADGYFVNRRFMFMGRWIRRCGYYPSWNLRLFRHRSGRYEQLHGSDTGSGDNEVHEHVVLDGKTAHLRQDMLHYAYPDIATWMEKHNRYSSWEARVEVEGKAPGAVSQIGAHLSARRRLREWSRRLPFRPTLRFVYSYLLKRGFLDGREGYIFCRLLATYEMLSVYKAQELRGRMRAAGAEQGGNPAEKARIGHHENKVD